MVCRPNQAFAFPLPVPAGLPRFFPATAGCARAAGCPSARLPSAALISSSSFSSIACSCSLRLPRRRTSSGLIVLRPACFENTSRSRAVFAGITSATLLHTSKDRRGPEFTNLSIDEFSQSTNKLWSCVEVAFQRLLVDKLADCVPEGGFEPLEPR